MGSGSDRIVIWQVSTVCRHSYFPPQGTYAHVMSIAVCIHSIDRERGKIFKMSGIVINFLCTLIIIL